MCKPHPTFCNFWDVNGSLTALIASSIELAHVQPTKDAATIIEVRQTITSNEADTMPEREGIAPCHALPLIVPPKPPPPALSTR